MRTFLLALALLMAGCATPAPDLDPRQTNGAAPPAAPVPRSGNGTFWVSNVGAKACPPGAPSTETGVLAMSVFIPLEKSPGDTSLRVRFEWSPVNPTAESLEFWLGEERQRDSAVRSWFSASPATLDLGKEDLEGLPDAFGVHVSATGCPPEGAPVHAVTHLTRQDVAYASTWNAPAA